MFVGVFVVVFVSVVSPWSFPFQVVCFVLHNMFWVWLQGVGNVLGLGVWVCPRCLCRLVY